MLKVLYIGDVSAEMGRAAVREALPKIKQKHHPDLVVANIENSAAGLGVTREIMEELMAYGIDLCTGGDHTFRVKEFHPELAQDIPFVRPANFEASEVPGKGYRIIDLGPKGKVAVIVLLGQDGFSFNQRVRNPFFFIDELLKTPEIKAADIRIVEIHAETTSEKLTLAWYLRGRVEAVVGTHTHVATADQRLLGGDLAYVTDIGQVGPYEAALWVDFKVAIHNFKFPHRQQFKPETTGAKIFNSVLISFENFSPQKIERVDVVLDA